jgi:hypothetical protein
MTEVVTVKLSLPPDRALALAELVKRLDRSNLGPTGLNLTNPHQPGEDYKARQAVSALAKALAEAGYDPR